MLQAAQERAPYRGHLSAERKLDAVGQLVKMCETALNIVTHRFIDDPPAAEPFPGAAATTVRQTLMAIDLARKAGLLE